MTTMKIWRNVLVMCAALLSLTSFNNGDSEYKISRCISTKRFLT